MKEEKPREDKRNNAILNKTRSFINPSLNEISEIPDVNNEYTNDNEELYECIRCFSDKDTKDIKKNEFKKTNLEKNKTLCKSKKLSKNNSQSELECCYNILNNLLSEYSLNQILQVILKISSNISIDENNKNNEIYQNIIKVNKIIKKKEDITMMFLSILSKRKLISKINESCKNKNIKETKKYPYILGKHYYNSRNGIYCFKTKSKKPFFQSVTAYCVDKNHGCNAKCTIFEDYNIIMNGIHTHSGISKDIFYKSYPSLKNIPWKNAQIIIKNGKDIIKILC